MNPNDLLRGKEAPRRLSGWYHIYDPEDNYRTMGQMKIEIQLQLISKGLPPTKPVQRSSVSPMNRQDENTNYRQSIPNEVPYGQRGSTRPLPEEDGGRMTERERSRIMEKENVRMSTLSTNNKSRSPINRDVRDKSPYNFEGQKGSVLNERTPLNNKTNTMARQNPFPSSIITTGAKTSILNLKKKQETSSVFSMIENGN
jgi:hypothetical protein